MSEGFERIVAAIVGSVLMFAPLLLAGQMAHSLARLRGWRHGTLFFAILAVVLGAIYFQVFTTDNALASAVGVLYAWGILAIAFIVRCRLGIRKPADDPRP